MSYDVIEFTEEFQPEDPVCCIYKKKERHEI